MYALYLEKLNAPMGYVVVGSLYVGDARIFGEDGDVDGRDRFSRSDPSWDGHAWLVSGDWLADVSIFRTAYSRVSPPALAAHVVREFGTGRGLMLRKCKTVSESGLRYVPQYVLTREQVDALGRGARAIVTGNLPS